MAKIWERTLKPQLHHYHLKLCDTKTTCIRRFRNKRWKILDNSLFGTVCAFARSQKMNEWKVVFSYSPCTIFPEHLILSIKQIRVGCLVDKPRPIGELISNDFFLSSNPHYRKKYDKHTSFSISLYAHGVFLHPPCTIILNFSTMVQLTLSFLDLQVYMKI